MKRLLSLLLAALMLLSLAACGNTQPATEPPTEAPTEPVSAAESWKSRPLNVIDDKYRTYYEIFVYSFYDSDGDGIGDLQGVIQKLDYIQELGCNGIWLMPIMPSPTYHKYDTTDYLNIDPQYGTLEDFKTLVAECHSRGIRLIIDLAMNHSSSDHPWFREAVAYLNSLPKGAEPDPAVCPYVDYYHFAREGKSGWSLIPDSAEWFYECQFWTGMPDLNLQSQAVRAEFEAIARFWLELGVDGFRLDAVKEFESGLHETNIEILSWFNDFVKAEDENNYLVCECWTDVVTYASYYESGVDSLFDFSFGESSGYIAGVLKGGSAASYGRLMAENEALYASHSDSYINAPFYTNHDMGRTCGFYPGATGEAKTKMGNAMNLLMTGNVFLYYGEELGMKGSGKDENKRLGMYWSADEGAAGMCDGPPYADKVEMKFGPLEEQAADETSVYSYVKDAILLRNQNPAIARGKVTFLEDYSGDSICAITKTYEGTELLILLNTTEEAADLDLAGLTVQGADAASLEILGMLLTGDEEVTVNGSAVSMPALSILVLGAG